MATILPNLNQKEKLISQTTWFFKQAKLGTFLHQANFHKVKGFSALSIVEFIFSLVLHGMSFSRALESDRIPKEFHKDAIYDLLKNPTYNWRKLLVLVSSYLIQKYIRPLTSEVRDCVLIFDDSAFYRNRSKALNCFAHTTIVFLCYIMLALRVRVEEDPQTLGQLFYMCCDEIDDIEFAEALLTIMETVGQTLAESLLLTDDQIQNFLDCFIKKLPNYLRKPLLKSEAA